VWWHYLGNQNTKQTDVARACRVSQSTVAMILNSKEGYEQFRRERNGMET
jgi:DNA-binding MarR family transcriptional regulator